MNITVTSSGTDLDSAVKFYSTVLGAKLEIISGMGVPMVFLPAEEGSTGGALIAAEGYTPSQEGTVVYLNGGEDLGPILDRVEGAGGQAVMPKTDIGEHGFVAMFVDTEGNKVGLHSMG